MTHRLRMYDHSTYTSALCSCRTWACYRTNWEAAEEKFRDHLAQVSIDKTNYNIQAS